MVQFDAEFHFLQHGTTTALHDALTPLPWPYFVFHFGYGANYFWSQLFNIGLSSSGSGRGSGSGGSSSSSILCMQLFCSCRCCPLLVPKVVGTVPKMENERWPWERRHCIRTGS
jgi:hypothetical protein